MNREEILEKSRQENKNKDFVEKEISKEGGNIAAITATILSTIFFSIQIFLGEGTNYGLYAITLSILATNYTVRAIRMKRMTDIVLAIASVAVVLFFSIAHIYDLYSVCTIL